jgi:hypothetical protein
MSHGIVKTVGTILSPVAGLLGAFDSKKAAAPAPTDTTPVMPLPDDAAIAAAKKRSIASQLQRGGRDSTILTDGSTLGG